MLRRTKALYCFTDLIVLRCEAALATFDPSASTASPAAAPFAMHAAQADHPQSRTHEKMDSVASGDPHTPHSKSRPGSVPGLRLWRWERCRKVSVPNSAASLPSVHKGQGKRSCERLAKLLPAGPVAVTSLAPPHSEHLPIASMFDESSTDGGNLEWSCFCHGRQIFRALSGDVRRFVKISKSAICFVPTLNLA